MYSFFRGWSSAWIIIRVKSLCQEWYSLSISGQAQSIPYRNTADFHGDGYILQNAGNEVEEISFVVCDVNSEKERLQVNFLLFEQIFI